MDAPESVKRFLEQWNKAGSGRLRLTFYGEPPELGLCWFSSDTNGLCAYEVKKAADMGHPLHCVVARHDGKLLVALRGFTDDTDGPDAVTEDATLATEASR